MCLRSDRAIPLVGDAESKAHGSYLQVFWKLAELVLIAPIDGNTAVEGEKHAVGVEVWYLFEVSNSMSRPILKWRDQHTMRLIAGTHRV